MTSPERTVTTGPRTRSVLSESFETFVLRVALVAIAFASTVVISRLLGPEGRGVYVVPIVAAGVLIAFAKMGLEQANVYLFGTRAVPLERLAAQNALAAAIIGGTASLLLIVAPSFVPLVFAGVPSLLIMFAALGIPFSVHTQFTAGLQNLSGQVSWQFKAAIYAGIAQLAFLGALIVLDAINIATVMLTTLTGGVLAWLITVARSGGTYLRPRWDAQLLRQSLAQSVVLHLGMLLFFLHLRVDMLMLNALSGAYAVGLYSLAVVLAETVLLAPDSVSIALLPRQMLVGMREAAGLALRAVRLSVVLAVVVALAWIVVGRPLLSLFFGDAFAPAYDPLAVLLPGMVFIGMQRVCGPSVLRAGRPFAILAIYAFTLATNVALNLMLIPGYGATGAALASSLSYALGAVFFVGWLVRLAGVPLRVALRPTRADYERARDIASGAIAALREARPGRQAT